MNAEPHLGFPIASPGRRLGAALIDLLLPLGVISLVGWIAVFALMFNRNAESIMRMVLTVPAVVFAVIQLVFLTKGQSIGKAMLGLQVVGENGEAVPFVKLLVVRVLVAQVLPGMLLPFLWMIIDGAFALRDDRRALHDHLAKTYVVKTRLG